MARCQEIAAGIKTGFIHDEKIVQAVHPYDLNQPGVGSFSFYSKELQEPRVEQLLSTKLFIPPTRPEFVPRPLLIEQLREGLHRKMTLISAPAGFGKTTLVTEWLTSLQAKNQGASRIAWLSLDKWDNELARFLRYFIATLNQLEPDEPDFGKGALSLLQTPQPPVETILTTLVNELTAIADKCIVILDDYHLIDTPDIHTALAFLLEYLPPQVHLVIITRVDPHLPLARLRSQDHLTEIRAADLRFSSTEAADFFNRVMGLRLSEKDVVALETRTEGWIAGLQLAAFSLQGKDEPSKLVHSFTGSNRLVLDYLIEEVLKQQPESLQKFLLQTSVLNHLSGSLCDALTGQNSGRETLEMLERANLFIIPLDEERRWYRYHHLFSDLLRQRLQQTYPELVSRLHHNASEWAEQHGFINEAIEHALDAREFDRAETMVEDHFGDNYELVSQIVLRRWLSKFPKNFFNSKPHLLILHAWNLFTTGQFEAADLILQTVEKKLRPSSNLEPVLGKDHDQRAERYRERLYGRQATIRSFLASYSGDISGTIQNALLALDNLAEEELAWRSAALITLGDAYSRNGQMRDAHEIRLKALATGKASGDIYVQLIVNLNLAENLRQQGKLHQVVEICERQMQIADEKGISEAGVVGWLAGIWGEALAEVNVLGKAYDHAAKGVKLTAGSGDVTYIVMSNLYLIRILFSQGDTPGAENVVRSLENTTSDYVLPAWAMLQLSAWKSRIWLEQGKLALASQWAAARDLDPDIEPEFLHEMEHIVYARILIAQEKIDEAMRLLQRLFEAAKAGGRTARMIEVLNLQAVAFQTQGEPDRAIQVLGQSLALAEPGGFIRIFVDEGPRMAQLLFDALSQGIVPEYIQNILAAFPRDDPKRNASPKRPDNPSEWIEPLSDRELEILQLIDQGLTNPEIGKRLYISLNTVKVHTRNIYSKLGVNNRSAAGARARALGILTSTV
jgi:LuxR family transcriptional regulator, maltose regulon positive regulatory protein